MGMQDRDWYRDHARARRDDEVREAGRRPAERPAPGAPPLRAGALLATLAGVSIVGVVAVAAVMAQATGESTMAVLRDAVVAPARSAVEHPWASWGALGLLIAIWLASRLRGRLRMLLVWMIVGGIGYAVSEGLLSWQRAVLEVHAQPGGAVELRRSPDGHYRASGAIDGVPVRFMIDTGASTTAVSQDLARKLRVKSCVPQTFSTAAGTTPGCVGRVAELTFATFRVTNAQVAVLPQMQGSALLGMNVLSRLHIEQRGSVLRIARADSD